MPTRTLPAAAVQKGDTVRFLDGLKAEPGEVTVARIENSTPVPGLISWTDTNGRHWTVSAADRVEVVRLS